LFLILLTRKMGGGWKRPQKEGVVKSRGAGDGNMEREQKSFLQLARREKGGPGTYCDKQEEAKWRGRSGHCKKRSGDTEPRLASKRYKQLSHLLA